MLAPIDETGGDKEPLYEYVRLLDREAEDIEAGRLFYVAATRAESRLRLLGCVKVDEDGVVKMPSRRSLLGLAWAAVEGGVRLPAAVVGEKEGKESLPAGELRRLPSDFGMPRAPDSTVWKSPEEGKEGEQVEFSWVGETARHVGTVVHRWLQRMADEELVGWTNRRIESLKPRFRGELQRRGVPASEIEIAAGLVVSALTNTIADERGRWLLGPHAESWTEYRMRTHEGKRYVADRRIREGTGEHWVIDYKTSRHEGADIEAFLDREQLRYAPQLDRYARELGQPKKALYFPLLRGWRAW